MDEKEYNCPHCGKKIEILEWTIGPSEFDDESSFYYELGKNLEDIILSYIKRKLQDMKLPIEESEFNDEMISFDEYLMDDARKIAYKKGYIIKDREELWEMEEYLDPVEPHINWLFEQIDKSKDGKIIVRLADFAEECGIKMQNVVDDKAIPDDSRQCPTLVYWGFKHALFYFDIVINCGKLVEDGQPVIIMRRKVKGNIRPKGLSD